LEPLVLVADDDDDDVLLLREAFAEAGLECALEPVADGDLLLKRLLRQPPFGAVGADPVVVVLDLNMPRCDGRAALRTMRQLPALAALPVEVLTTSLDPLDRARCLAEGAQGYHTKPSSFAELVATAADLGRRYLAPGGGGSR
jgi:two-component system response regulator